MASFVSHADRFFEIEVTALQSFWDDDSRGCRWGNTGVRDEGQQYASELSRRYKRKMFLRLVGLSLAGAFPSSKKKDDASLDLPRSAVLEIIDGWVGEEELPNPLSFAWASTLESPHVSVAHILSSPTAETNTRSRGRA